MQQPPESLKSFANRLAKAAISDDGNQTIRLLRLTNLMGSPSDAAHSSTSPDDVGHQPKSSANAAPLPANRVGIWERKEENGQPYFVRSKDMLKEWNYWANIGRIDAKGKKKRVVFIGESVARGYLYDPQFNCAMALEKILHTQMGIDEVEIVDLARTNLGFEVRELAIAALQLEPDFVVIFSGNNWRCDFPPGALETANLDAAVREKGAAGAKQIAECLLIDSVKRVVKDVASLYDSKEVPLLWIIPEFNLGDWRDPFTNAPHLPGDANREWLSCCQGAQEALETGDLIKAAELATRMVELDHGVSVAEFYILAECSRKSGDIDATRRYLELARDSVIWDSSKSAAPRTYSVAQQTLREEIAKHKSQILDMPKLFKAYLQGVLPDRRLFLDYCHMTTEGIQVTMAAVASHILQSLKHVDVSWTELVKQAAAPSNEVEAEAAFLAAVHSAHWWQAYDVIHYFCARAIQFSRHIVDVMTNYIDLQTRQTPMLMCRSAELISGSGSPLLQHYLLRYNNQQLDKVLLDAIVNSLGEVGINARHQLDQIRLEEHSVLSRETNLLEYYYCSAGYQPQEVNWVLPKRDAILPPDANHYYKAYWRESNFAFVAEAGCPICLQLSCRLPNPATASKGTIVLQVNGISVGELAIGPEWEAWNITIPGNTMQNDLNEIKIQWPIPDFPGPRGFDLTLAGLSERNKAELYPVFGEIHTLTASDGREAQLVAPALELELSAVGAS
ncbi:MAG TPA: hypothetical protein VHA33_25880 [Candidatus Angelobacter sp.]|jgi:hypothetical protein|nr:hypothetical protein [Candidatus Angelobacter sp.]